MPLLERSLPYLQLRRSPQAAPLSLRPHQRLSRSGTMRESSPTSPSASPAPPTGDNQPEQGGTPMDAKGRLPCSFPVSGQIGRTQSLLDTEAVGQSPYINEVQQPHRPLLLRSAPLKVW